MPAEFTLALGQHMGTPATPCVAVGEKVLAGQVLANPAHGISAAVHAPTSGTITAIGEATVAHPSGMPDTCITLVADGKQEWRPRKPLDIERSSAQQIMERITSAGIIGMGGAGFPSAMKLPSTSVETLIINGVECEPYISSDDMLMRTYSADIMRGISVLTKLLSPKRVLIAVEDNKPEAYSALCDALRTADTSMASAHVEIHATPTQYPSGGERQLIQMLLDVEVPSGTLPITLGVVCHNVGTVMAIAQAVCEDRPLTERVITLTGGALEKPRNYLCPIGTPVSHLLKQSHFDAQKLHVLIVGGPMMGFEINSTTVPVTKTTNCIIAGTEKEFPPAPPQQACIRCGLCAEACPALLLPQQLYWFARASEYEKLEKHNLFDCIECGACSWVCPSHIPLVQYYRSAKGQIRHRKAEEEMAQRSKERFDFHQTRIAEEKERIEERRRQRRAKLGKSANNSKQEEIAKALQRVNEQKPPTS